MAAKYDHKAIEKKWQKKWAENNAFAASDSFDKEKLYILDMFPYPSGAGLHVGHVEGYTATDIYSRFKRMQGYNVLHPMGWDAFGLPAENYAIKTGIPPQKTTDDAIKNFTAQIKSLGLSYDWSREIGTHTPEYYQWTQWFFLFLFKNGLAEKRRAKVNWCPRDQTVLANEQVVNGCCERCGTAVIQKDLEQWFFKITDFADQLVDDLDQVDWPESTKIAQRNWIGRSEGAEIDFSVTTDPIGKKKITVFTTRADTIFGATYLVVAPEHPWLAEELAKSASAILNKGEAEAYIESAKNKTDLERQEEGKEKTGVELKGVKAINPANGEEIPIFVADYVLGGYGTGAIMVVPAHDERDYQFAKKFNLPIKEVILQKFVDERNPPQEGKENTFRRIILAVLFDPKQNKYLCLRWKTQPWTGFVTGGIEGDEDPAESARREIAEETGYTNVRLVRPLGVSEAYFFAGHKNVNRKAHNYMFLFELVDDTRQPIAPEEEEKHEAIWLSPEEVVAAKLQHAEFDVLWNRIKTEENFYTGYGTLFNSGEFDGLQSEEAKKKIVEKVGGKMVKTYRLRDWLISRQRYWGAPIPVVYDPEGSPHAVPEEHLPWMLPTDVEFKPTGTSPLGQSKELLERTEKIFGKGWTPEIDTMDTFVCSSWYYFRFADPHNAQEFASKELIKKWLPVDLYVGGAEHTVLHLMYARFFTKVLQKFGLINFSEPFLKLRHQGIILAEDGNKMSKSKGNVINPDDVIAIYGADTLRLYEMFMGPLEAMKPWSTTNIIGVRRFLERVWKLGEFRRSSPSGVHEFSAENSLGPRAVALRSPLQDSSAAPLTTLFHQTVKKVGEDIENLKFNTAISSLMILLNELEKLEDVPNETYRALLLMLAPLAPHIASELWEKAGFEDEVTAQPWPHYDESKIVAATVQVAVQVNGKMRATIALQSGIGEEEALQAARADQNVAKWLALGKEERAVYVAGKVINFVVTSI